MAEVFGSRILSEVKAERLDELLHSLRELDDPHPTGRLGIDALDDILEIFTTPLVWQQNLHQEWDTPPRQHISLERKVQPPVIEICGVSPCSGKTQLLYHVAATSMCPSASTDTRPKPMEGAVIWIDTDTRFDIHRLHSFLQVQILGSNSGLSSVEEENHSSIKSALQQLHVFRPQSSVAFLATIQSIPSYLLSLSKHYSSSCSLKVVIISNISAFLHQDRLDSDLVRDANALYAPGTLRQPIDTLFAQQNRDIVNAIRDIQAIFPCTIIAGNISISPLQLTNLGHTHRPHLPGAWDSLCAVKIFVSRKPVPKFELSVSAKEAGWNATARKQVLRRTGFRGWVDPWGSEAWGMAIRKAVERKGTFDFQVYSDELRFAKDERAP